MSQIQQAIGMAMHMVAQGEAEKSVVTFSHNTFGDFEIEIRRPNKQHKVKKKGKIVS